MVRSRQNWAPPSEQAAMLRRPPSSARMAILKPSPSAPTRLASGMRQASNMTMAVGFEPRKRGAAHVGCHVNAAEAERRRLPQRVDGEDLVFIPLARERQHLLAREGASGILDRPLFLGEFEVHAATDSESALHGQSTGGGGSTTPWLRRGNHEHGVVSADAGKCSTQ